MIHSTPGTVVKECLITASTAGFCCWFRFSIYPFKDIAWKGCRNKLTKTGGRA